MAYPAQNGATHRHPELWQSSGQSRYAPEASSNGSISEKIGDMFHGDRRNSLPMYKDKPYAYPGGRRRIPWFRQKRAFALVLAGLAGLSWWLGILSPLSLLTSGDAKATTAGKKTSSSWNLFGSAPVDWDERAEKVKEAFKMSFADYEKHAWGMCRVWPSVWEFQRGGR